MKKMIVIIGLSALMLCSCQNKVSEETLNITSETNADKYGKSYWWYEGHTSDSVDTIIYHSYIKNTEQKDKYVASLDFDSYDEYLLEKIAVAETNGDNAECMAAVMMVVLNRAWSSDFPMNIEKCIEQDGQFASVLSGDYENAEPNEESKKAMSMILYDKWDEVNGALYFEKDSSRIWIDHDLELTAEYDGMRFYR